MYKYLLIALTALLLLASTSLAAEPLSPAQIAQLTYDRYVGDDMQMHGTMELISKSGHVRSREFISLRKDDNAERKQLIRFTAPADIDGTAFLTIERQWQQQHRATSLPSGPEKNATYRGQPEGPQFCQFRLHLRRHATPSC